MVLATMFKNNLEQAWWWMLSIHSRPSSSGGQGERILWVSDQRWQHSKIFSKDKTTKKQNSQSLLSADGRSCFLHSVSLCELEWEGEGGESSAFLPQPALLCIVLSVWVVVEGQESWFFHLLSFLIFLFLFKV